MLDNTYAKASVMIKMMKLFLLMLETEWSKLFVVFILSGRALN